MLTFYVPLALFHVEHFMLDIVMIMWYNFIKGGEYMSISDARRRANAKYNAKAYEQFNIRLKIGERSKLQCYVSSHDISLNSFATSCMSHCIENNIDVSNAKPLGEVLPNTENSSEVK